MSTDEIVKRLEAWKKLHDALDQQAKALEHLTGAMPDCQLMRPVWGVWSAYTVAVSELIGDDNEWLDWYQFECDMGRKPLEVSSLGGKTVTVRTLRQLARVISY